MNLSRRWRHGLIPLLAALLLAGCNKNKGADKEEEQHGNPLLGGPQPGAGGILRTADRPKVMNELRQIATLYKTYETEFNKPPRDLQTFLNYIKTTARNEYKRLSEGYYILVPGVRGASNAIVAYEAKPDQEGLQYAARADGSVNPMSSQELEQALKKGS